MRHYIIAVSRVPVRSTMLEGGIPATAASIPSQWRKLEPCIKYEARIPYYQRTSIVLIQIRDHFELLEEQPSALLTSVDNQLIKAELLADILTVPLERFIKGTFRSFSTSGSLKYVPKLLLKQSFTLTGPGIVVQSLTSLLAVNFWLLFTAPGEFFIVSNVLINIGGKRPCS